ncbi:Polyamine transporter [Sphaerulina musiva]
MLDAVADPQRDLENSSRETEVESILEAIEVGNSHDVEEYILEQTEPEGPGRVHEAHQLSSTRVRPAQDWDGPHDPGNPLNWSSARKARHFWPVALLSFSTTTAASLITPASPELQESFSVSRTVAFLPLTLYVIGLGLGPTIAAPLSEQFGRSLVYKVSGPVSILFLLSCGLSKSFASLCVCRLLAGTAGAPVLAIGSGTNADLFAPHDRALWSALSTMMPLLGPALGPIIGGFAAQSGSWQWTVWCMIIISGLTYLTCLPMHETYKKTILQKRAKRLGLPVMPSPNMLSMHYVEVLLTTTLVRPVSMMATEPIVLIFGIYNALGFAIIFSFFAAFPYTFTSVYGFNTSENGLVFMSIGLGVLCGVAIGILCDQLIYMKKHKQAVLQGKGILAPEERLYAGMIGATGLPVGLLWFAWTARPGVHWVVPVAAGVPFAMGNLTLFLSSVMYQIDIYGPRNGASAMAANGLMRNVLGGCAPLFVLPMYERMGISWATSLLGFICLAMLPIPFAFYQYGPSIRKRSLYHKG